ncbi:Uma2 family endonuclease [bacterium]|nr:MAG: Uma2 family endonuclease [bacterium]
MAVATALTVEDYLALEERAERKYELHRGELVEMPGGSISHSKLVGNMLVLLDTATDGTGCEAFGSETKLVIGSSGSSYYPDAMVACPALITRFFQGAVDNPRVIVEVLSPSTEAYDRSEKFRDYILLPSVHDIVYVSSTHFQVEVMSRVEEGWLLRLYSGTDAIARIPSIEVELPLAKLYAKARVGESPAPAS